jgi:hypothetical protein
MRGLVDGRFPERLNRRELCEGVLLSNGRVVAVEVVVSAPPLVEGVPNPVLAAVMGADILVLNRLGLEAVRVEGLDGPEALMELRRRAGIPFLANMEPLKDPAGSEGQEALVRGGSRLLEAGVDGFLVTCNPYTAVPNRFLVRAVSVLRQAFRDSFIAVGKMHGCGVVAESREGLLSEKLLADFLEAGADGVLIPLPGVSASVPRSRAERLVAKAHELDGLVIGCLDNSLEGSSLEMVERLALESKAMGADIHHIGDAGYAGGIAPPENLLAFAIAIKGRKHTYRRMAAALWPQLMETG